MRSLEMLEQMNLRVEFAVTARSWLEEDNGDEVRSEAIFDNATEARQYAGIIAQFKKPDGSPSYTHVAVAQRFTTDWSTEAIEEGTEE